MRNINTRRLVSGCIVLAVLSSATALVAQEQPPICGGVEATIAGNYGWQEGPSPILGTEGPDVIHITGSGNRIDGLGGDDIICIHDDRGGYVEGGDGDDIIYLLDFEDRSSFGTAYGQEGNDTIYGSSERETLYGGNGDDLIYGRGADDVLLGDAGNDTIYGGYGGDVIQGGNDGDTLYGGPGRDRLFGNLGPDTLHGGPGGDELFSNEGERIRRLNQPTLSKDTAGAIMFGGPGNDLFYGSNKWDRMQGGPGNDSMWGFEGRDWMRGGPGDDSLVGGQGIDNLAGNTGADAIMLLGADRVSGGFGIDLCSAYAWDIGATIASCERSSDPDIDDL
jgi:Ca2+-binding RTX toxin-like protein